MSAIDTAGWPPLTDEALRTVLACAETLAREAAARGRDAEDVIAAAGLFGRAFQPRPGAAGGARVSREEAAGGALVHLVEPPVGCSLCLVEAGDAVVMVDSGYRRFRPELLALARGVVRDFDARRKVMLLTHGDVDHSGLIDLADEAWMSRKCAAAFVREAAGGPNLREETVVQGAFERMVKRLSGYAPPPLDRLRAIGGALERYDAPLSLIGTVEVGGLRFEAWEGRGGHVTGECVFVERRQRIAFTGDVYCNLKGCTPEQAAFNALSVRLLGSVDEDKATACAERKAIFDVLGAGKWKIFGGHGGVMTWNGG